MAPKSSLPPAPTAVKAAGSKTSKRRGKKKTSVNLQEQLKEQLEGMKDFNEKVSSLHKQYAENNFDPQFFDGSNTLGKGNVVATDALKELLSQYDSTMDQVDSISSDIKSEHKLGKIVLPGLVQRVLNRGCDVLTRNYTVPLSEDFIASLQEGCGSHLFPFALLSKAFQLIPHRLQVIHAPQVCIQTTQSKCTKTHAVYGEDNVDGKVLHTHFDVPKSDTGEQRYATVYFAMKENDVTAHKTIVLCFQFGQTAGDILISVHSNTISSLVDGIKTYMPFATAEYTLSSKIMTEFIVMCRSIADRTLFWRNAEHRMRVADEFHLGKCLKYLLQTGYSDTAISRNPFVQSLIDSESEAFVEHIGAIRQVRKSVDSLSYYKGSMKNKLQTMRLGMKAFAEGNVWDGGNMA